MNEDERLLYIYMYSRDCIRVLGESTFEKVYDYFVKRRMAKKNNPDSPEGNVYQELSAFVKKPSDCLRVEELVFFELP